MGNVENMINCRVLRCQRAGSIPITGGEYLNNIHESYVCEEHKKQIDDGARWDIQDTHVLMDQDLAPALEKWSARSSLGTEGFTLSLETTGDSKPFDVFLTPENAKLLYMLLKTRGGE